MARSAFVSERSPSLTRVVAQRHEPRVLQADQREEEADACGNAELKIERDGVDQPFAYRRDRDQEEQGAGQKHDAKRELPIAAELGHHGEGEIGVEPHARGERDGVVGVKPHDGGRERRGEAGGDEHRAMIHAGFLENCRVDEHDVGHGEEGREAALSSVGTLDPAAVRPKMRSSVAASPDGFAGACVSLSPRSSAISYLLRDLCLLDARLRGHDNIADEGYPHVWQRSKE